MGWHRIVPDSSNLVTECCPFEIDNRHSCSLGTANPVVEIDWNLAGSYSATFRLVSTANLDWHPDCHVADVSNCCKADNNSKNIEWRTNSELLFLYSTYIFSRRWPCCLAAAWTAACWCWLKNRGGTLLMFMNIPTGTGILFMAAWARSGEM